MAPVVTMETARAKNNSDRRFVTKNWILCFMNDVSPSLPRLGPGELQIVAAGKPSGHSNLGLGRSSEVPLRAAGVAGPKTARRSQLLRDATFYSLRKLCLWKFGYHCTEVPIWVRTRRCPDGGSTRPECTDQAASGVS